MQTERIIDQLEKMVASGGITPDEAARLLATAGTTEFDAAVAAVRSRHAQSHTDAAVADGRMSPADAETLLARVRDGEHSAELRSHIRGER